MLQESKEVAQYLTQHFPLFKVVETDSKNTYVAIETRRHSTRTVRLPVNESDLDKLLTNDHRQVNIENKLNGLYPDLFCSIISDRFSYVIHVWIKRDMKDGFRDGAGIPQKPIDIADPELHPILQKWQKIAKQVRENDDMFFCTGHGQAEKRHEGQWSYFAGRYCKKYGEEHPDLLNQARNESYN